MDYLQRVVRITLKSNINNRRDSRTLNLKQLCTQVGIAKIVSFNNHIGTKHLLNALQTKLARFKVDFEHADLLHSLILKFLGKSATTRLIIKISFEEIL